MFNVDAESAFTRLKLVDFAVADNDFAQLVVELMGSKLIMAIVDLVIDRVDIDADSVTTSMSRAVSVSILRLRCSKAGCSRKKSWIVHCLM